MFRVMGRLLAAAIFVLLGWDAAKKPDGMAQAAAIGVPQPELAVRVNGLMMTLAGAAFALGVIPRWAAVALAATLVPTTIAGHPFWKESDPQKRQGQYIHFLKNLSMIGALLLTAAEKPQRSLTEHAQESAKQQAKGVTKATSKWLSRLAGAASL